MTLTLLPSGAVVTVAGLKANADLTAICGGRIGTKLNATLPAIRVQRISGTTPDVYEDQPVMQLECWAADEGTADQLARTVVAVLPTVRGTYPSGHVYTYQIESGPYSAPDDPTVSLNSRYIVTARLLTSP